MTDNIHFKIEGGYQYEAFHNGICFQRSWHGLKFDKALDLLAVQDSDTVLDAACGSGVLTDLIASASKANITAVDFNEVAIRFCKATYQHANTSFIQLDLNERHFSKNTFDKIVMLEVLEHLPLNVVSVILKNVHYYLKPGGRLVLSTPNKRSAWPLIEYMLDTRKLTPKMKGEQHVKLYDRASAKQVLESAGFKIKRMETTHLIAPWLSFFGLNFSKKLHKAEQRIKVPFGSLLFVVAEK